MSNLRDDLVAAITAVYIKAPGNQMAKVEDVADAVLELTYRHGEEEYEKGYDNGNYTAFVED